MQQNLRQMTDLEIQEAARVAAEHAHMLTVTRGILSTENGQRFFKYLFREFSVGVLPPRGLDGPDLADMLGYLRAGQSIFKLAAEADSAIAGSLLALLERDRQDEINKAYAPEPSIEHGNE